MANKTNTPANPSRNHLGYPPSEGVDKVFGYHGESIFRPSVTT